MPEHDNPAPWVGLGPEGLNPDRGAVWFDPDDPETTFFVDLLDWTAEKLRLIEAERREFIECHTPDKKVTLYGAFLDGLRWIGEKPELRLRNDPLAIMELDQLIYRTSRWVRMAEAEVEARAEADRQLQTPRARESRDDEKAKRRRRRGIVVGLLLDEDPDGWQAKADLPRSPNALFTAVQNLDPDMSDGQAQAARRFFKRQFNNDEWDSLKRDVGAWVEVALKWARAETR